MSGRKLAFLAMAVFLLSFSGCRKPEGGLNVRFTFSVDGAPLVLDSCMYVNAAGNEYEITDVQYFVSEFGIIDEKGMNVNFPDDGTHYVDARMPGTLEWDVPAGIVCGKYNRIAFVFGLRRINNLTGRFLNPPENNMSWPQTLGGGYHYMKINGRWKDGNGIMQPYNLHMGKVEKSDSPQEFADNVFIVTARLSDFAITEGNTSTVTINMDINKWFESPNVYDFNVFGGAIMQNAEAQKILAENGKDVFSVVSGL